MTTTRDSAVSWTVGDLRHEFSPVAQEEIAQYIRGPAKAVPVEGLRPQPDHYPTFFAESQNVLIRLEDEPGAVVTSVPVDEADPYEKRTAHHGAAMDSAPVTRSAVVLVAGQGTRISSVTSDPKCLLDVAGKALIDHHLDNLEALGFTDLVLVVGYRKDQIRAHVDARQTSIEVRFVDNPRYDEYGNAYSLAIGLEYVTGPCIAIDGDLIYEPGVLERFIECKPVNTVLVGSGSADDIEAAKVVLDQGSAIAAVVDKRALTPAEAAGFLGEAIGVLHFDEEGRKTLLCHSAEFFSDVQNRPKNWEHLLNFSIPRQGLEAQYFDDGRWIEIDTPEDYARAGELFGEEGE